jgi:hypothetical protein
MTGINKVIETRVREPIDADSHYQCRMLSTQKFARNESDD